MNNTTNNQQNCDVICKKSCRLQSHERDLYRVCPSKLSKRELENLYFALLENNLELKKTLHSQQDKIKILSTKLQRMTVVQRNSAGKEKDCCNSKVLVNEQKEIIAELKNVNEQMSERIRLLNMRLCSAKQFLKRSPSKCPRCGICPVTVKNSSMSTIEARPSQTSIKMTATSFQNIPTEASEAPKTTREVETETDQYENEGTEKQCNENKCRTVMDELKQKIVDLQEELSKTHDEYSKRISKLENDVSGLHQENTKVRSSKAASEHALEQKGKKADDLRGKLKEAERNVSDLKMQLAIEKRKVKELETTLKLANTSSQVVQIMEKINTPKPAPAPAPTTATSGSVSSSYYSVQQDGSAPSPKKSEQKCEILSPTSSKLRDDEKFPKSDDSGYTDLNKSSDADESKASYMERLNQEMLKKIADLQMQLDDFRIKAAGQSTKPEKEKYSELETYDDELQMAVITITDPKVVVEIQELDGYKKNLGSEKDINTSTPIKGSEIASSSSKTSWNELVTDMDTTLYKNEEFGITSKQLSLDEANSKEPKREDDNRYQIPGPIPTTYQPCTDKKKQIKNGQNTTKDKTKKETNDPDLKTGPCEQKCIKITNSFDDDVTDSKTSDKQAKSDLITADTTISKGIEPIKKNEPPKGPSQKIQIIDPKETQVSNDARKTDLSTALDNLHRDSVTSNTIPGKEIKLTEDVEKVPVKGRNEKTSSDESAEQVRMVSTLSYYPRSDTIATPPQSAPSQSSKEKMSTGQTVQTENVDARADDFGVLPVVGVPVDVGQWPPSAPPNVPPSTVPQTLHHDSTISTMNRRDSTAVPLYRDFATSAIPAHRDSATSATPARRDSATYTAMPVRRVSAAPARRDSATFTKPGDDDDECKCARETSPANTERDVSSLSDLPPEKDGKSPRSSPVTSPRDARSPGEEKATSTYTDTDTRTYDYGPLSDGELPTNATHARSRKLSFGEQPTYVHAAPQSSQAQMEATLNAISEELAHCRKMLAATRDHEVRAWDRTS